MQLALTEPARLWRGVHRLEVKANMSPIDATCLVEVGLLSTKLKPSSFSTRWNVVPAVFAAPAAATTHRPTVTASAVTVNSFEINVTLPLV